MDSKVRVRRGGVADLPGQWRIVACTENAAKDILACHPADRLQKEARSFVREGGRKVPDHGGSERAPILCRASSRETVSGQIPLKLMCGMIRLYAFQVVGRPRAAKRSRASPMVRSLCHTATSTRSRYQWVVKMSSRNRGAWGTRLWTVHTLGTRVAKNSLAPRAVSKMFQCKWQRSGPSIILPMNRTMFPGHRT